MANTSTLNLDGLEEPISTEPTLNLAGLEEPIKVPEPTPQKDFLQVIEEGLAEKPKLATFTPEEGMDIARVGLKTATGLPELVYDILDWGQSKFTGEYADSKYYRNTMKSLLGAFNLSEKTMDELIDNQGKVRETTTTTGGVANMATLFAGYGGARKLLGESKSFIDETGKSLVASIAAVQATQDPDDNISNWIQSVLDEGETKGDPGYGRATLTAITDVLATDQTDSQMEKRMKLVGEEVLLGTIGPIMKASGWAYSKASEVYKTTWNKLTKPEKVELAKSYLREARETAKIKQGDTTDIVEDIEIAEAEIGGFKGAFAKITGRDPDPLMQPLKVAVTNQLKRFFTSKGYLSPRVFNAFSDAEAAQRALISRAENLAVKIDEATNEVLDNFATISSDPMEKTLKLSNLKQNARKALSSDTSFLNDVADKDKLSRFMEEFTLPKEIAEPLLESRMLIDELSSDMLQYNLPPDVRAAITDNLGSYIRRSYELFENPDFVPDPTQIEQTKKFLVSREIIRLAKKARDEELPYTPLQITKLANAEATKKIDEILASADKADLNEYFVNAHRINKEILYRKKDVPEPVRKMMGEILEPSDNVLLTISKLAKLKENTKFFKTFEEIGKRSNWLITDQQYALLSPAQRAVYTLVEKTNSNLDGETIPGLDVVRNYYIPKPVNDAIKQRDQHFQNQIVNSGWYKNFLYGKGQVQAAQTIYNHVTHLRNIAGGAQFMLANGMSPFSKQSKKDIDLLFSQMRSKGTAEQQKKYEEYLDLGVINTSVRINEFRQLIERGNEAFLQRAAESTGKQIKKYTPPIASWTGKAAKRAEDLYMATDDFFKIAGYEKELAALIKASPEEDIAVLQKEAARIIRDTFPNYDKVPAGVKAWKELPLGNFISFPAEILRTSVNIVQQASKEITSGNPELRKRGMQRLVGFSAMTFGWEQAAEQSAAALGWTPEQKEAADSLVAKPWSNGPFIYFKTGDTISSLDTQFVNSYSYIQEPINAVMKEIESGQLKGLELEDYLSKALVAGTEKLYSPYIDPSILTKSMFDVISAIGDPKGRNIEGRKVLESKEFADPDNPVVTGFGATTDAIAYIASDFVPGAFIQLADLGVSSLDDLEDTEAFNKVLEKSNLSTEEKAELKQQVFEWTSEHFKNPSSKKNRDAIYDLVKNASGFKFEPLDADTVLKQSHMDYVRVENDLPAAYPDYTTSMEELKKEYFIRNKVMFRGQQELYGKVQKVLRILPGTQEDKEDFIFESLIESGLREGVISAVLSGYFKPSGFSDTFQQNVDQKVYNTEQAKNEGLYELYEIQAEMEQTPLNAPFPLQEEFDRDEDVESASILDILKTITGSLTRSPEEEKRQTNYKGSLIHDVPTVPEDPLLRVNKETGNSYAEDAGVVMGGRVLEALQRSPKRFGGKLLKSLQTRNKFSEGSSVKPTLKGKRVVYQAVYEGLQDLFGLFQNKMDEVGEAGVSIKPAAPKHLDASSKNVSEMDVGVVKGEGLDPAKSAQEGGEYVDYKLKRVLTGRVFQDGQINPFISPRPQFKAKIKEDKITTEDMKEIQTLINKETDKDVAFLRTNLLDSTKYKILSSKVKGLKGHTNRYGISAVQATDFKTMKSTKDQYQKNKGMNSDHIYGLHVDVKGEGALLRHLKSDPKSKYGFAQPSLRPHFVGDIVPGKKIGTIKVGANNHPLYDVIRIDAEDLSRPSNVKEPLTNESIVGDMNTYFDNVMDMKNVKSYEELEEQAAIMKTTEGGTLADLTRTIASESKNASHKIIARKVTDKIEDFEKEGFNFTYRVVNVNPNNPTLLDKPVPNYIYESLPKAQGGAYYDFDTNTQNVYINNTAELDSPINGLNFTTGLHESVHSVLSIIAHVGKEAPATSKLNKDYKRLDELHQTLLKTFNRKAYADMTLFERRIKNKEANALENVHEVVAWGLTDRNMQEFLESIPYQGNKTMWNSFVETIRKVLGLEAKQDTALSELLSVSSSLFETKPSTVMERLTNNTGGLLASNSTVYDMDARLLFNHGGYHATAQEEIDAAARDEYNQARRAVGVGASRRGSLTGMPQSTLVRDLNSMAMQTVDEAVNTAQTIVNALPDEAKERVFQEGQRQIDLGKQRAAEDEAVRTGKLKKATKKAGKVAAQGAKVAKKAIASNPYVEGIQDIRAQDTLKGKAKTTAKVAMERVPYVSQAQEVLSEIREADTKREKAKAGTKAIINQIPQVKIAKKTINVLKFLKNRVQERRENRN